MVTDVALEQFHRDGILRLPTAVPTAVARAMRDRLWGYLSAVHGKHPDAPATWTPLDDRARFKTLRKTGAFDDVAVHLSPVLTAALGCAWVEPEHWGKPLLTFGDPQREWAIPATGWHVDSNAWSVPHLLPGVVAFTFLDTVEPEGGGTLVVAGSHHLTWARCERAGGHQKTGRIKASLTDHPWFASLWDEGIEPVNRKHRATQGAEVDGVPVRVVELTGRPGDVVMMNQRCLHVAAPNVASRPRMMLAEFISKQPDVA